jgi:GNAT superfamily N-acetyltransferase
VALEIELVNDDEALADWHDVEVARAAKDEPGLPTPSLGELRALRGDATPRYELAWLVGRDGGEAVACGSIVVPRGPEAPIGRATAAVTPSGRGRGHGRAMATAVVAQARTLGCAVLQTMVASPLSSPIGAVAGDVLAASLGATAVFEQVRRRLTFDHDAITRLEALAAGERRHAAGYELVRWCDAAPDELVGGMAELLPLVASDSPTGALALDATPFDVARVRDGEALERRRGRRSCATGARSAESGELVGYTLVALHAEDADVALQRGTVVRAAHRGHRLGLLVKVENVRQLRARFPKVERVETWNAVDNEHMVSVNELMGFEAVLRYRTWQLLL